MAIRISTPIVKMLQERGFLPKHCRSTSLYVPPDGAMVLTFEIYVTEEHLDILGDVFKAQAEHIREQNQARESIIYGASVPQQGDER